MTCAAHFLQRGHWKLLGASWLLGSVAGEILAAIGLSSAAKVPVHAHCVMRHRPQSRVRPCRSLRALLAGGRPSQAPEEIQTSGRGACGRPLPSQH